MPMLTDVETHLEPLWNIPNILCYTHYTDPGTETSLAIRLNRSQDSKNRRQIASSTSVWESASWNTSSRRFVE
eukprot:1659696-Amphidinium_carterae.1